MTAATSPVETRSGERVVGHLVEWFPAFLHGSTGITLPTGPPVGDAPVGVTIPAPVVHGRVPVPRASGPGPGAPGPVSA